MTTRSNRSIRMNRDPDAAEPWVIVLTMTGVFLAIGLSVCIIYHTVKNCEAYFKKKRD